MMMNERERERKQAVKKNSGKSIFHSNTLKLFDPKINIYFERKLVQKKWYPFIRE